MSERYHMAGGGARPPRVPALPRLYLITDSGLAGEERLYEAVAAAARAGVRMVQLRDKSAPAAEVARQARRLRSLLPPSALLIVNGTGRPPDFARTAGAGGAHLGGGDLESIARARKALPEGCVIGYSAHRAEEIAEAARRGADYVSLSPVHSPRSKRSSVEPLGLEALRRACAASPLPVFALGGIGPEAARECRKAGAYGVAVVGAILQALDPEAAARALLEAVGEPGPPENGFTCNSAE